MNRVVVTPAPEWGQNEHPEDRADPHVGPSGGQQRPMSAVVEHDECANQEPGRGHGQDQGQGRGYAK